LVKHATSLLSSIIIIGINSLTTHCWARSAPQHEWCCSSSSSPSGIAARVALILFGMVRASLFRLQLF
jgi:hypothetical protein